MTQRSHILIAALVLMTAGVSRAQSVEERAEQLNNKGKELFGQQRFQDALAKFRQAVVVSPKGKYYFNVCFTLTQLQRYEDALTACQAVEPNDADDKLREKASTLIGKLQEQIAAERAAAADAGTTGETTKGGDTGSETRAGDGGPAVTETSHTESGTGTGSTGPTDGGIPGGAGPGAQAGIRRPPPLQLNTKPPKPRHDYEWGLGVEFYGLGNFGVGDSLGGENRFGDGGFYARFVGSLLMSEKRRVGGQAYVGYSSLPTNAIASSITDSPLSIIDVGIAGFWHLPLSRSFYLTPLIGGHLSFQGPADSPELFIAAGGRAAVSFDFALGDTGRHVFSATAGLNFYSRAAGESNGAIPADFGLDSGGMTAQIGLGYTLRFMTPLGEIPVITLE